MKSKVISLALFFGGICGLLSFLFFLALYSTQPDPLSLRRPDLGFNVLFVFLSIWYYRKKSGGYLQFYEGFSVGFLTNLIAALISAFSIYLFLILIDITPFTTWISEGKKFLIEQKVSMSQIMSEENFNSQLKAFDNARPHQLIFDELIFKQFAVVAVSLTAMALRRQKN